MKIAYLILAHRYPEQLIKLTEILLSSESSVVIIHIDLKSELLFNEMSARFKNENRVTILSKRYKVYWGSYNQILATLELIKAADRSDVERSCLLSGQDLPVKPIKELEDFFKLNFDKEYLVNFKLPDSQWESGGIKRMSLYYVNFISPFIWNKINRLISIFQNLTGLQRKVPDDLYGGSNWFNLSKKAIRYITDYIDKHPDFLKRFKYTRTADEIIIQTILLNSPYRENVISDDLRFVDWSTGPEFPRIFRTEDEKRLLTVPVKFFARKFDEKVDKKIIKSLYERFIG